MRLSLPEDEEPLRDQVFKTINKSDKSGKEVLQVLEQCTAYIRDQLELEKLGKECDIQFKGFQANDDLELYFNIIRNHHDVGYISKGWDDPGFRIGDVIEIEQASAKIYVPHFPEIHNYCATNGIVMTVKEREGGYSMAMDGVIYSEGFNKGTLMKTLNTLAECVEKAKAFYKKASEAAKKDEDDLKY